MCDASDELEARYAAEASADPEEAGLSDAEASSGSMAAHTTETVSQYRESRGQYCRDVALIS